MENEIDVRSIIGLLRRQAWIILSSIVIVLAIAAVAVYSITPKYTATTKVIVDLDSKDLLNPNERASYSSTDINARVESEVEILQSDNAILQVIKDEGLLADPEFGVTLSRMDRIRELLNIAPEMQASGEILLARTLQRVRQATSIDRAGLTYVIDISFTSTDPKKAARLANAIANTYIQQQVQSKISRTVASRNIIQAQIGQANTAIVDSTKKFDAYLNSNIDRLEQQAASSQITELRSQLEQAKRDRDDRSALLSTTQTALDSGDLDSVVSSLQSDALKQLLDRRNELNRNVSAADNSARAINLRQELERVDRSLREQAANAVGDLKRQVASGDDKANQLRDSLRSSILSSNLPPEVLTDIYSLQQDSEIARNQYQSLLQRLRELDTKAQLQVADSRVVNTAIEPDSPSSPNKNRIFLLAGLFGLALGGGAAVMREHFVGGFTTEDQVEPVLHVPLAAVIPKAAASANTIKHGLADLVVTSPISAFAESIRRVRVAIERQLFDRRSSGSDNPEGREGTVILVSSSEPNEGKSTVSLALSRTLASSGKKTLLIDCDLRKPSIHRFVGIDRKSWFTDLLSGSQTTTAASSQAIPDPLSSLALIVGGRPVEVATDELVMGERFAQVINTAKRHFDYIVIDTPPVAPIVDALYLARYADMMVFVVRWASTSQSQARKSIASLIENAREGTPVTVVLNQKERSRLDKDYNYYGYYGSS